MFKGINPSLIPKLLIKWFFSKKQTIIPEVVTPIYKIKGQDLHNPNLVKTLVTSKKEIIYFSRSALPFIRDKDKETWSTEYQYWGHVGIYGYRGDILRSSGILCLNLI